MAEKAANANTVRKIVSLRRKADMISFLNELMTGTVYKIENRDAPLKTRTFGFGRWCFVAPSKTIKFAGLDLRIASAMERPTRDFVINDCGTGDFLPILGSAFGWHYGMAGATGFSEEMVLNRFHEKPNGTSGGHGLYFDSEFVNKYWKPFLIDDIAPLAGTGSQGEHLGFFSKMLYHGWLR